MTRRLARLALTFYPMAFRRRYGEEMRALLDQSQPRVLNVLDVLRGALLAHLRPASSLAGLVGSAERVRASASSVLACWVVFAAAGLGFYKTTEDPPFAAAGRAHQLLGAAHSAVQLLALVGSAGVLVGALPLIIAAVTSAAQANAATSRRRASGTANRTLREATTQTAPHPSAASVQAMSAPPPAVVACWKVWE